jgi:hypothetical protein
VPAPQNVRVVTLDGQEIPVECTYAGVVDGRHQWVAVTVCPQRPERVLVGMMPAKTAVVVRWTPSRPDDVPGQNNTEVG